jgi:TldD protein
MKKFVLLVSAILSCSTVSAPAVWAFSPATAPSGSATSANATAPATISSGSTSSDSARAAAPSSTLSEDEKKQKQAALKADTVLRAMHDELSRSMKGLKLPNYPLPYFGSYGVTDEDFLQLSASFGAVETNDRRVNRYSDVALRVGDKKLDNSAASGGVLFGRTWIGGSDVVTDDDYDAIRYGLWMQTDSAYKQAVESLESAKARLRYLNIEERPDCFSDASPVVSVVDGVKPVLDVDAWQERVRKLSAIFKEYPTIETSNVFMNVRQSTRRFINSEGTLTKCFDTGVLIGISASVQCKDGMDLNDYEFFAADSMDQLPSQERMEEVTRGLCKRVSGMLDASRAEEYQGPVLFEKQSAAELATAVLPRLVCARAEMTGVLGGGTEDEQVLDKPVLASCISVFDDPTSTTFNDERLKGGWTIDFEGVRASKLKLVDKGILKTLCSTRTPTRIMHQSNGHFRGSTASPGHLVISTDQKTTLADLKNRLIELGKKDQLPSVLIVRRSMPGFLGNYSSISSLIRGRSRSVGSPVMVYRVDVKSGKEELIRGARFKELPKRGLLDLELACDDAQPYTVEMPSDRSSTTLSLITPSILVKDLEVSKPPRTTELPPYLKNPYFEEQGK